MAVSAKVEAPVGAVQLANRHLIVPRMHGVVAPTPYVNQESNY
jgi:hypothetical protein